MFLVLTKYVKPMDEIERLLPSHSEHLQNYYNQKNSSFQAGSIPVRAALCCLTRQRGKNSTLFLTKTRLKLTAV